MRAEAGTGGRPLSSGTRELDRLVVMSDVRIGLVGYGFGGRFFHAPFLATAAGCEFLGVVTTSAERRHDFAEQFPGRATFDSLEQLAAAGAEAVTISTPASTHVELTQRALRLGLAVVCDKPFALDAASARQTVLLSQELMRTLTVFQNRRWDSDFRTVRKALADGVLGDPVRFESRFERFAPDPGPPHRAAERCWTSAATWSTRLSCCSAQPSLSTPRCTRPSMREPLTTTSFSPSRTPAGCDHIYGATGAKARQARASA